MVTYRVSFEDGMQVCVQANHADDARMMVWQVKGKPGATVIVPAFRAQECSDLMGHSLAWDGDVSDIRLKV